MTAMAIGAVVSDEDLPMPSFRDHVGFWLALWSADRPELVARARAQADPERDPWGYYAVLGQLLADA